jgi:large subunit ribosomal protein L10
MSEGLSKAKELKAKEVEEMKKLFEKYPVIGIIDMFKLPTIPMQKVKKKSRGEAIIKMTKKAVLMRALDEVKGKKKNFEEFKKLIPGQPAIVFTEMDPFKFYGMVDKLKVPAAAKDGDTAPKDIEVSAGPTNLLAGPAISELTKVGIPAGVEEGKISVKKDVVVAKKGTVINKFLANALKKLGIEPMLIGLNVVAVYQNGMIYPKEVLSLVGEVYINKVKEAFTQALNLSVSIGYPTKANIGYLLAKAKLAADVLESRMNLNSNLSNPEEKKENESGGTS